MRRFVEAAVLHPVTTTMITVAVLVFGLVSATRLPVDLLPDLSYPTITVQTEFPDAAPAEVEELVTRPVEERTGAVPGIVRVESSSREGISEVILDFAWGTSIDQAMADVREKLDRVELPTTASRPLVLRYDPSQEPVMRLALRDVGGKKRLDRNDLAVLRQAADVTVKRELEKVPGVAAVQLHGGEEDEVLVEIDPSRLAAHGLSASEVVEALRSDNINRPGGALTERDSRYLVRTVHEARTPEALGAIIVRSQGGAELRVRDVARVHRAPREREEISLVDGKEVVELAVYREGDANVVAVAEQVRAAMTTLPLAPGQEVIELSNRADFIESAVTEVRDNTLVGGGLAVLVLLFFLRDLRSTAVIALAIPISLLATFVPMAALDVSINVMSLGGLALGVGMLVDNSIVVLESIARVRDEMLAEHGKVDPAKVATSGTAEVAGSVVASTLTTIAVFFPMAFVEGVAGQLVRDLSYAVSFSLLSSMLVSLTLVPVLQSLGRERDDAQDDPAPRSWLAIAITWPVAMMTRVIGALVWVLGRGLGLLVRPLTALYDMLEARYPAVMRIALRFRGVILLGAVGICIVSLRLIEDGGRTLIPELDQGEFHVQVALPTGASLERTATALQRMSDAVAEDPAIERRFTRIGSVTVSGSATGTTVGPHLGQLGFTLEDSVLDRAAVEARILEAIQQANPEPQATLALGHPTLFNFAPPVEVLVFSEDQQRSTEHVRRLLPDLRAIEGLADVVPDDLQGRPEVEVDFDRERLGRLGLTVDQAATAVQRAIQGEIATTMYTADRQLDVRVLLPRTERSSVEDVARIQVAVVGGIAVPLSAVAKVRPGVGPSEIRRIDGRRGIRISARTDTVDLAGVAERVKAVLAEHAATTPARPQAVEAVLSGQASELRLSMESLVLTGALSLFLVYVVMASSFESLLHPFIILFTVPLALAGVALAVWLANVPLSAMVGIGVIVLGGIVVNNAIVLINAVNDRRGRGMSVSEALVEAGRVRVRPILMTTLTTILGLVPMAMGMGDGAALRQPLAIAIIGGLGVGTLLTLVVIPCAYSVLPGRRRAAWGSQDER